MEIELLKELDYEILNNSRSNHMVEYSKTIDLYYSRLTKTLQDQVSKAISELSWK